MLPLSDSYQSSFVWSGYDEYVDELMQLSPLEFGQRMSRVLGYKLGNMTLLTERMRFPLVERSLDQPYFESVVLIGDAAHTIHPLAGQGANCGLQDAIWLSHCYQEWCGLKARKAAGLQRMFSTYFRRRKDDYDFLRFSMRCFSDGFGDQAAFAITARSALMSVADQWGWAKGKMMSVMAELGQLPPCVES